VRGNVENIPLRLVPILDKAADKASQIVMAGDRAGAIFGRRLAYGNIGAIDAMENLISALDVLRLG